MTKAAIEAVQAKGERTRQNIMDAAEELFGKTDFDSISLRDVAQEADVLLGVISYHFKSKAALFEAVVTRRADALNELRISELRRYENPTIEQVLDAFVRPVLIQARDAQWSSYLRIMAQISSQARWKEMHDRLYKNFSTIFMRALETALPGIPRHILSEGADYAIIVLLGMSMMSLNLEPKEGPSDTRISSVVTFLAGGFRALPRSSPDVHMFLLA